MQKEKFNYPREKEIKVVQHNIFGIKMIGKGSGRGSHQGRGGLGGQGFQGRGRTSRGYSYYGYNHKHKVLFSALGIHVFD